MKCTFYRPEDINLRELFAIIDKLREDLDELETGNVTEDEAARYLACLLPQAEALEKNPAMRFFGFDKPESMDSDARVDFFYWPTYVAAALCMKACLLYPGILEKVALPDGQDAESILRSVLLACTGRGFRGHGFEDMSGLVEVAEFFVIHGAGDFIDRGGVPCPEFAECFDRALDYLLIDAVHGFLAGDPGDDYADRAGAVLEKAKLLVPEEAPAEDLRLYLAYGSNLNVGQMRRRCPDVRIAGTAELSGWRLMFKGSKTGNYLTIERGEGFTVPVAAWAVSEADERSLDRYEGCPSFYYKKELPVTLHEARSGETRPAKAFVYIMHEERRLGRPTKSYVDRCREGYAAFGFDPALLEEAFAYSSGT
jgi:hypothetical protein